MEILENSELFEIKTHSERMSLLNDLSQEISMASTEEEVFKLTALYTSKIFKAERAGIALLTEDGLRVEAFALVGDSGKIPLGSQWLTTETVVGFAIQEKKLIVTDDAKKSNFVDLQKIAEMGLSSAMNTPLITGGKVIGTLNIATKEANAYNPNDQKLILQAASIIAANIQNRRLVASLQASYEKSESLLLNVLPKAVAEELKEKGSVTPVYFEMATILFTDFKGFTQIAENLTPGQLIEELDFCFSHFDKITEKYNLEKLKTIGDSYMCAGGLPTSNKTNPMDACLAALEIQAFMEARKEFKKLETKPFWELRLGIHTGPVMAGVIGEKKFAYDVWGDTVNTASRLESSGVPGKINISQTTYEHVKSFFECEYRGKVNAKNKGEIDMYFLNG